MSLYYSLCVFFIAHVPTLILAFPAKWQVIVGQIKNDRQWKATQKKHGITVSKRCKEFFKQLKWEIKEVKRFKKLSTWSKEMREIQGECKKYSICTNPKKRKYSINKKDAKYLEVFIEEKYPKFYFRYVEVARNRAFFEVCNKELDVCEREVIFKALIEN